MRLKITVLGLWLHVMWCVVSLEASVAVHQRIRPRWQIYLFLIYVIPSRIVSLALSLSRSHSCTQSCKSRFYVLLAAVLNVGRQTVRTSECLVLIRSCSFSMSVVFTYCNVPVLK
jgi:hypothetical protein